MSRKLAIIAALSLFAAAASVTAAKAAGPTGPMTFSIQLPFYGPNVLVDFKIGKKTPGWMSGGSVLLIPCTTGQQRLDLVRRTRHLANGESLRPYKFGVGWVYQFPSSTGKAGWRHELKIPIKLLRGKGGSGFEFCVQAMAVNFASQQYSYTSVGFGVK